MMHCIDPLISHTNMDPPEEGHSIQPQPETHVQVEPTPLNIQEQTTEEITRSQYSQLKKVFKIYHCFLVLCMIYIAFFIASVYFNLYGKEEPDRSKDITFSYILLFNCIPVLIQLLLGLCFIRSKMSDQRYSLLGLYACLSCIQIVYHLVVGFHGFFKLAFCIMDCYSYRTVANLFYLSTLFFIFNSCCCLCVTCVSNNTC